MRWSRWPPLRGGRPEDPFKDDPLDFVLWQPSAPDEPSWESLLGPGPAGVAHRVLGAGDARAGHDHRPARRGRDLIFPHHECESAQSRGGDGLALRPALDARGMVGLGGEKMSKSLGNLVFVHDLLEQGRDPSAVRLALLSQRYRRAWEWTRLVARGARKAVSSDGVSRDRATAGSRGRAGQARRRPGHSRRHRGHRRGGGAGRGIGGGRLVVGRTPVRRAH